MPKRIKTKGRQVASVPNTPEGQEFLERFRKYANCGKYRFKKHGRGGGEGRDTSLTNAKWVALYFYDKDEPDQLRELYQKIRQDKRELAAKIKKVLQKNLTYEDYVKLEPTINEQIKWDVY